MSTSIGLNSEQLYYRVNHPEFKPDWAYRAIAYIDYGESAWSQLLFVTHTGMTYCVKVKRCLCITAMTAMLPREYLAIERCVGSAMEPLCAEIIDQKLASLPWPKPTARNPDLEDD